MIKEITEQDINLLQMEGVISADVRDEIISYLSLPVIGNKAPVVKIHLQEGRVLIKVYQYDINVKRYYVIYTKEIKTNVDRDKIFKVLYK